ncbi:hypothetical protein ACFX12_031977 [Malus domestica]
MRKSATIGWPWIRGARRRKAMAEAVAVETTMMVAVAIGGGVDVAGQRYCRVWSLYMCNSHDILNLNQAVVLFVRDEQFDREVEEVAVFLGCHRLKRLRLRVKYRSKIWWGSQVVSESLKIGS